MKTLAKYANEQLVQEQIIDEMKLKGRRRSKNFEDRRGFVPNRKKIDYLRPPSQFAE